MNSISLRKVRVVSITVLLVGALTAGLGYSVKRLKKNKQRLGFTIISTQTFTADGKAWLRALKVRYQKSDGAWKLVTTYYGQDGEVQKEDVGFGQLDRGVFQVDRSSNSLNFISPMDDTLPESSEESLRNDPAFLKEDVVSGYKTYVLRFPEKDSSSYSEIYYAPELRSLPIKHVFASREGVEVIEPVRIDLGDPGDEVFNSVPDLPVSYELFEKKIEAIEEAGYKEAAAEMRKKLAAMRQSK